MLCWWCLLALLAGLLLVVWFVACCCLALFWLLMCHDLVVFLSLGDQYVWTVYGMVILATLPEPPDVLTFYNTV